VALFWEGWLFAIPPFLFLSLFLSLFEHAVIYGQHPTSSPSSDRIASIPWMDEAKVIPLEDISSSQSTHATSERHAIHLRARSSRHTHCQLRCPLSSSPSKWHSPHVSLGTPELTFWTLTIRSTSSFVASMSIYLTATNLMLRRLINFPTLQQ
jgi:hypothetical protein